MDATAPGAANDQTEVVTEMAPAAEYAWSDEEAGEFERPLPKALIWLLAVVAVGAAVVGALVVVDHLHPAIPVAAPPVVVTTTMVAPPPPPVTITPPPVTITQTPPPPPPGELSMKDRQFLAAVRDAGIKYPDPQKMIVSAHAVCRAFLLGESETQVLNDYQAANPQMDRGGVVSVVAAAETMYCPQYGG